MMLIAWELFPFPLEQSTEEITYDAINNDDSSFLPEVAKDFVV
jgi:hypothetical protein